MKNQLIELGAVYQTEWSSNPIRIIAFDSSVVMYDTWWPHKEAWGMERLTGKFSYYRLPITLLLEKAKYLRTDKYSEKEVSIHRPDLPFAFAQNELLDWYDQELKSVEHLENAPDSLSSRGNDFRLKLPAIYLSPFGPKDSSKPAVLVHAKDGESFSESEVLWHAWQLQHPHLGTCRLTSGVGVYRSGVQRSIPSYYIWGSQSKLEQAVSNAA